MNCPHTFWLLAPMIFLAHPFVKLDQNPRKTRSIPEVILAPINVSPIPHALQGKLADESKGYSSLFQKIGEITPIMSARFYGEDNPAAVILGHLVFGNP